MIKVGDGSVNSAFLSFDLTAVSVGGGIFWIDRDSLIEVSHGPVQIALPLPDDTPVVVSESVTRTELDGLL